MVLGFYTTHAILTNRKTGDDVEVIVTTKTDRFAEVSQAIARRRRSYPGYELFETF